MNHEYCKKYLDSDLPPVDLEGALECSSLTLKSFVMTEFHLERLFSWKLVLLVRNLLIAKILRLFDYLMLLLPLTTHSK